MDVLAYVISSLAILWSFGGGQLGVFFWTRVLIAAPICLGMAYALLRSRKDVASIRPLVGSWMMGVGLGFFLFLTGLLLAWLMKNRTAELVELANYRWWGLIFWALILAPASEIIFRKYLAPSWGTKSSAFVEALNYGVGAVSLYLFVLVFVWAIIGSKINLRFGIVTAIVARSIATLLLIFCLKAVI